MTTKIGNQTQEFLAALFGEAVSERFRIGVFTLPEPQARHFTSTQEAAEYALERAGELNVFYQVCLAARGFGRKNSAEDIAVIAGLWADVDMVAPYRANKPLPRNEDEARGLLAKLPLPPSVIVHSGYGLHAYWLFKEPWVLETEEEWKSAARTAHGWHAHLCALALERGWKMENTGDLARVLRVPGTVNRKIAASPVPVRMLEHHEDRRYNPDDFEAYIEESAAGGEGGPAEGEDGEFERRARKYVAVMPHAVSGDNGHDRTYTAATALVHGFGLQPARALVILLEDYNPRCEPPWDEKHLRHKVEDAAKKPHNEPYLWLREGRVAGEQPDISGILESLGIAGESSPAEAPGTAILLPPAPEIVTAHELTPKELYAYDVESDPNTLLGRRWLCRAGSCLLVGQTGLGKSSFCMQAAVTWGLGESLFGITPVRPLKSLIIQAENDTGDLAEMFRGVLRGTGSTDRLGHIESQIVFVTDTTHSGRGFHPFARSLIVRHSPDLVWVDPLFACLGGNASDQEAVSTFLRGGLGAIAQETGIAWMIAHHTNKPPRDPAQRKGLSGGDYSYLGSGSAELANWARAVLVLRGVQGNEGVFELRAAKRGKRAGLVDVMNIAATEIYLKHGQSGICWERAPVPEDERRVSELAYVEEVLDSMEKGRVYSKKEVRELVQEALDVKKAAVLTKGRRAYRVYHLALDLTRCTDGQEGHKVTEVTSGHKEVL